MRRGFTLLEVLVALLLSSIVAMLAHHAWAATLDATRALAYHQRNREQRAALHGWLEEILGSLDAGVPGTAPFRGTASSLAATAAVMTPEGWPERFAIGLSLEGRTLWCTTLRGRLALGQADWWKLEYLVGDGQDARWLPEWESEVNLPTALRIQLRYAGGDQQVDTILVVPGRRG